MAYRRGCTVASGTMTGMLQRSQRSWPSLFFFHTHPLPWSVTTSTNKRPPTMAILPLLATAYCIMVLHWTSVINTLDGQAIGRRRTTQRSSPTLLNQNSTHIKSPSVSFKPSYLPWSTVKITIKSRSSPFSRVTTQITQGVASLVIVKLMLFKSCWHHRLSSSQVSSTEP